MGLDVFEEVVASWLQTKGYFMMNNVKYGNNQEIDILATKVGKNQIIHIEVSCSSNPIGIFGIKKAGEKDYQTHALNYLSKKYFNQKVKEKIEEVTGSKNIQVDRWFIHAKLREPRQLDVFKSKGIITIHINSIIEEIKNYELKKFVGDKRLKQLFDIMEQQ